jgi:uncharacterized protein involved in exopolysaccharide biosynthesis
MSIRQRIDLAFVAGAVRRYRRRATGFFLLAMAAVILGLMIAPRQYSSEARLFLRVGRESGGLDPTATMGDKISVNDNRQNEINSALEMLRSRELCRRVVDRIGPAIFLDPPASEEAAAEAAAEPAEPSQAKLIWTTLVKSLEAVGVLDPVDSHERAVQELSDSMTAAVPRNTHLIAVSCRASTPENAQKIVETIVACFAEMHMQAHRTPQSHEFFVEQSESLKSQIQRESDSLSKRKNELGLVSLQGQRLLLENERSHVEQQLATAIGQLAASRAKLQSLEAILEDLPKQEVIQKADVANLAADSMRQLLYQLEIQEREQSAVLAENHPRLVALRQQLKDVKGIMAEQATNRAQTTTGLNPTRQPLHVALLTEKAAAESWDATVKSLKADQERVAAEMKKFNGEQVEIEQLERELALHDTDYRSYAVRREQARIDQVLAAQQISNLNVVQTPTLVRKPVRPQKLLTFALGLVAAIGGAICLAVVSAAFNRSFHEAEELESALQVPVLLTVPEFDLGQRPLTLAEMEEADDHATA